MTKKALAKVEATSPPEPEAKISIQAALLEVVSRKDIDPDRLERFLEIQQKMENRQAELAFNKALSQFQGECPIIPRTKKTEFESRNNTKVKYNYSPLDEIAAIIKPILSRYGLAYSFDIKSGDPRSTLLTTITHRDGFSKTTTIDFETFHADERMNLSQRRKSAITYTKRAGLENALGIITGEEDDDARRAIDNAITKDQLEEIEKILSTSSSKDTREAALTFAKVKDFKDLSEYEAKKLIQALKLRRAACIK